MKLLVIDIQKGITDSRLFNFEAFIDARNIKISSYRGGEGRDNRHGSLMPV